MISIADDSNGPKWVSEELYGREKQIEILNRLAAERSPGCVLVQGQEGTGKSSLMEVIPWEENGWVFVAGRYEHRQTTEPYSGLVSALDKLVELWAVNNSQNEVCQMDDFCKLIEQDIELLENVVPGIFAIVEKFAHGKRFSRKKSTRDLQKICFGVPVVR
eukprot:scaffold747_cov120-Cylindrotheca_fusiformis.AAC.1